MTFLPIVERELRVAARRKSTFLIRLATVGVALALVGISALFEMITRRSGGKYVFEFLSGYVFFMVVIGGIFLASDCLSRERREGTLGFLFLTDLKGYDVVLGKFIAISLNAFYGLLAVLPVLSLTVLSGGVTGAEFWRMSLALVNVLFFSTTASIWISSRSVTSQGGLVAATCLLFGVILFAVFVHAGARYVPPGWMTSVTYLDAFSPSEPVLLANNAGYFHEARTFWWSLAISNLAGWLFLGMAAWSLPNRIELMEEKSVWARLWTGELFLGKFRRRTDLLEINPVAWLMDDSRQLHWLAWVLAGFGGVLMFALHGVPGRPFFNLSASWAFYFLLKVFFAIQACRFFSEARRSDLWELLRVTPLTGPTMVRGQWLALRQIFLWPVIVFMTTQIAAVLGANSLFPPAMAGIFNFYLPLQVLWQFGKSVADFFAVGWVGMWIALTAKKPETAAVRTILIVLVGPVFAFCVPRIVVDVILIIMARSKVTDYFPKPSLILGGKAGH